MLPLRTRLPVHRRMAPVVSVPGLPQIHRQSGMQGRAQALLVRYLPPMPILLCALQVRSGKEERWPRLRRDLLQKVRCKASRKRRLLHHSATGEAVQATPNCCIRCGGDHPEVAKATDTKGRRRTAVAEELQREAEDDARPESVWSDDDEPEESRVRRPRNPFVDDEADDDGEV